MTTFKKDFPEIDEAVQRDMTNTVNKSVDYRQGVLDNRKRTREAIEKRRKEMCCCADYIEVDDDYCEWCICFDRILQDLGMEK